MPFCRLRHCLRRAVALLFSFQCLLIAAAAQAESIEYTLQDGDTLWELSRQLLGSTERVQQLQQGNGVKRPRLLRPGVVLQIPRSLLASDDAPITATFVSGDVSLIRADQSPQALRADTRLAAGDRIDTAAAATAQLHFFDGSRLRLRENSSLRIQRGESFGGGRIRHIEVYLDRGLSEYHIAPQRDPNRRFEIITPAATTSVRGTRFRVSVDAEGRLQEEVLQGETLVHNTLGQRAIERGQGIAVTPGEPPSEVVTLLPPPNLSELPAQIDSAALELRWPALEGAERYSIQLAEDAEFRQLLLDQQHSEPALTYRTTRDAALHLRVAAIDAAGFVGLPASHSLRLSWQPPAPQPQPAESSAVFPHGAGVSWAAVDNAERYRVQLAASDDFAEPLRQHWLDRPQGEIGGALLPGRYFWRVQAVSAEGRASASSRTATLRIEGPRPAAPEPFELHDLIVLRWPALPAADRYELALQAARGDGDTLSTVQADRTIAALPLPEPGDYLVRLRARYANGNHGPWSPATALAVKRRPYEVLLLPLVLGM